MPDRGAIAHLDGPAIASALGYREAVDALQDALRDGLDPELDPPRSAVSLEPGQLLAMPSSYRGAAVAKLVTVGGDPRIQGLCVVFEPVTLRPAAVLDAIALTLLRTAAVSALALRRLAAADPRRLVVFGTGPQARAHAAAIAELHPSLQPPEFVTRAGRPDLDPLLASADVICCCTTATTPLFDGGAVADGAVVIAIGSHQPDARELDAALLQRATVVVESRGSAAREAGDLILAGVDPATAVTLRELVAGGEVRRGAAPAVFKSTGMSWEDAVVAVAVAERAGLLTTDSGT
jgi:ornithine cyclodeaminase/alanine dehydrogenase-like protein (mu-crystallin family)